MNQDIEKTALGVMDIDEKTQMVSQPQSNATQMAMNVECPVCRTPNPPSETYCMDCGFLMSSAPVALVDMPEQVSVGKLVTSDGTREFPLNPGVNTVGRENSDVLLTHATVSRKHATITVENGKVYVEDAGSTNGTYVAGKKIGPGEKIELEGGCEVTFGSMALKFEAPEVEEVSGINSRNTEDSRNIENTEAEVSEPTVQIPEAGAESADEASEAEPVVDDVEGASASDAAVMEPETKDAGRLVSKDGKMSFTITEGTNSIGRRDGNGIIITDPYCSGRHAEIVAQDGKFTFTDIGSTNGTLVNGVKLDANVPRELQESDEITIGQTVFHIEVV